MPPTTRHWLVKTEPEMYSIDDLERDRSTYWDGVRNYQARNFMRDQMQVGDLVLVHHSSVDPPGVAGVAKVLRGGYPDHTAWTKGHEHEDPKSTKEKPIWSMVDLGFVEKFERVVSLAELKKEPALKEMSLLQTGQRLSVMPVSDAEFAKVVAMGRAMGRAVGAKAKSGEPDSRKSAATPRKRRP